MSLNFLQLDLSRLIDYSQDISNKNNNPFKSLFARFHRKLCEHISNFFPLEQGKRARKSLQGKILQHYRHELWRVAKIYISRAEDSFMPEIFPIFTVVAIKESNAAVIM